MQLKTLCQLILISTSILILSACTSTGKKTQTGPQFTGEYDGSGNARASGINQGSQFSGQDQGKHAAQNIYYFDFDKSIVQDSYKPAIYANADYLIAHPNTRIILEGHTDPLGSREYNVALGERRANAVAEILKSRGVNSNQIRVVSYGAERLAVAGHSEDNYKMDRRAVIVRMQG